MDVPSTIAWRDQRGAKQTIRRYFVMTVDVDGWSSLLRFYSVDHDPLEADSQVSVEDGILRLLQLFEKHEIKATFFVTGEMTQKYAEKIRAIIQKGHEVACHGLYHERNECLLSKEEQQDRIEEATRIIEKVAGQRPVGFRAPCLRANKITLEVLNEMGYLYDSSFLPMFVPRYYGSLSFRLKPYYPLSKYSNGLLEIPISVSPIVPFPLSASWMRNLGLAWVKFGIKMLFDLKSSVMFYIHPRDVLCLPSMRGVPWHLYRNTGNYCLEMLDELLRFVKRLGGRITRAMDLAFDVKKCCN